MRTNIQRALELIKQHEGGYVDHPRDPGGCTNMGITLATFRQYIKADATCEDVKNLSWEQAAIIYNERYWSAVNGANLPSGLDIAVFDMAVNAGPGTAARLLQRLLGVAEDGDIGPITLKAAGSRDLASLIREYSIIRLNYYSKLSTWPTFGKGWESRVMETERAALKVLESSTIEEAPEPGRVAVVRMDGKEVLRILIADGATLEWEDVDG